MEQPIGDVFDPATASDLVTVAAIRAIGEENYTSDMGAGFSLGILFAASHPELAIKLFRLIVNQDTQGHGRLVVDEMAQALEDLMQSAAG